MDEFLSDGSKAFGNLCCFQACPSVAFVTSSGVSPALRRYGTAGVSDLASRETPGDPDASGKHPLKQPESLSPPSFALHLSMS